MKEIQTNGITLLLVEVPEDATDFRVDYASYTVLSWATTNENGSIELSSGKWVILGRSTELSEEQMKEICEPLFTKEEINDGRYHYELDLKPMPYKSYTWPESGLYSSCDTVQESYLSLLEANGIVDRNPIPEERKNVDRFWLNEYLEAQSKVKHYLVLKRI